MPLAYSNWMQTCFSPDNATAVSASLSIGAWTDDTRSIVVGQHELQRRLVPTILNGGLVIFPDFGI
ncbi:hypothetical protein [Natronocalculus amylovorans]|uniref:Uncharacterized protein n=1 Tax=Natronocalculus amylovorans TaxID=2917812 RepID=A0AAE3FY34_9EURY|nr:hypothetical protein [Natronocalculus amylovorans]MCL9817492.1 hypothetical protein [Natronocalculus amylovorans]